MSGATGSFRATEYAQGSPIGAQGVIGVRVGGRGHKHSYRAIRGYRGQLGAIQGTWIRLGGYLTRSGAI